MQRDQPDEQHNLCSRRWLKEPWPVLTALVDSGAPALTSGHSGRVAPSPLLLTGLAAYQAGKHGSLGSDEVLQACMEVVAERIGGSGQILSCFSRVHAGSEREAVRLVFSPSQEGIRAKQQLLEDRNLRVSVGGSQLLVPVAQHTRLVQQYNAKIVLSNLPGEFAKRGVAEQLLACAGYQVQVVSEHLPETVGGWGRLSSLPRCDKLVIFVMAPPDDLGLRHLPAEFTVEEHTVSVRVSVCVDSRPHIQAAHPTGPGPFPTSVGASSAGPGVAGAPAPSLPHVAGLADAEHARRLWCQRRMDGSQGLTGPPPGLFPNPQQLRQYGSHPQQPTTVHQPPRGQPTRTVQRAQHNPMRASTQQLQQPHSPQPAPQRGSALHRQQGGPRRGGSAVAPCEPAPQQPLQPQQQLHLGQRQRVRESQPRQPEQPQRVPACGHGPRQHGPAECAPAARERQAAGSTGGVSAASSSDGFASDASDASYGAGPSLRCHSKLLVSARSAFLRRLHGKGGQDWACDAHMRTLPTPGKASACLRNGVVRAVYPKADALVTSLTDRLFEFDDLTVFRNAEERVQLLNWLFMDYPSLWRANRGAATTGAVHAALLQELHVCAQAMQAVFDAYAGALLSDTTYTTPVSSPQPRRSARLRSATVAAGAPP